MHEKKEKKEKKSLQLTNFKINTYQKWTYKPPNNPLNTINSQNTQTHITHVNIESKSLQNTPSTHTTPFNSLISQWTHFSSERKSLQITPQNTKNPPKHTSNKTNPQSRQACFNNSSSNNKALAPNVGVGYGSSKN